MDSSNPTLLCVSAPLREISLCRSLCVSAPLREIFHVAPSAPLREIFHVAPSAPLREIIPFCAFAPLRVAIFLLCPLLFTACFEPKQGCLDLQAVNFDASADKDCETPGCACIYPRLQISIDQRYDSLPYRRDSLYTSDNGARFRLHEVNFYLSDFQVVQPPATYAVSDTLGLRVFSPDLSDTLRQVFRNDFQLVRLEAQTYSIGTLRQSGIFTQVRFRVGLSDEANRVVPRLAPGSHPLSRQADSLWVSPAEGYVFLKVVVGRDAQSVQRDTLLLTRADVGELRIEANGQFVHVEGYDFALKMKVDFHRLLGNVNWSAGDKTTWKKQIVANLPMAFTVSQ